MTPHCRELEQVAHSNQLSFYKMKSTQKSSKKAASIRSDRRIEAGESSSSAKAHSSLHNWLQLGQLRAEKCELDQAEAAFSMALDQAKKMQDLRGTMEALAGLLRIAGEALDEPKMLRLDEALDELMASHPKQVPPLAWYCKGTVATYKGNSKLAQRCWHRYLRSVRRDAQAADPHATEECFVKGWVSLAVLWKRNKPSRSRHLATSLLKKYEQANFRSINGILYTLLGNLAEQERDLESAMDCYHKAHGCFLAEHNWYHHLYVLYGYARISRIQQNYPQAYWYLDLVDKAASGSYFGYLRREVAIEKSRLEQDAVDLLIDSRKCVVKTRESGNISLRKQYILLHILEALTNAHSRPGDDMDRGLSKAEIIERVWKESYRPEAHDNKLYYNINRLRKLIEPDVKKPQYLLNWKEGYRLAPGLRIQFVGVRGVGTNLVKGGGQ